MADIEFKVEQVYVVIYGGREVYRGTNINDANAVINDLDNADDGTEIDQ